MSQPRASSASATIVMLDAIAPSSGYDETNQPSARSHWSRPPRESVSDDRAPPATSTAAEAAADSPAANSSDQSRGLPCSMSTSGLRPATPSPSYSGGTPLLRQRRASTSSSCAGNIGGSSTTGVPSLRDWR